MPKDESREIAIRQKFNEQGVSMFGAFTITAISLLVPVIFKGEAAKVAACTGLGTAVIIGLVSASKGFEADKELRELLNSQATEDSQD